MTHEDWIKLTHEEQQIEVRSCLGFDKIYKNGFWGGYYWKRRSDGWFDYYDPDYLTDLNAMHEAEKLLDGNEQGINCSRATLYKGILASICMDHVPIHATAAQRAEAFVIVMTK
jgi:hypothetical protein